MHRGPFDPLVDFDGMWTTALAEHYLPLPYVPAAKYECLDGKLIMSPHEPSQNSYAAAQLSYLAILAAKGTPFRVYGTVNLPFTPERWIQPDITVLNGSAEGAVWVEPTLVTLAGEVVSPTSRRGRIDKPTLCAEAGIPFYLWVQVNHALEQAAVHLYKLDHGTYRPYAGALAGQKFETDLPFPMSFDPAELLDY
ncbi:MULTISPECIES: Uma2 family endonuclease [unclassified Crossiella]|uniref:Uma2 family endonuclease n=1 Tax=unclassified Crossiella TaxID=2620835 RepID=UPI001FFFFF44|nr:MULTISPECIES: Uma2 family endonuclease [unclassified Crossiella]MCK2236433.1 Uma2 family endonuclease [Crossiella sp. S99.2]MCK2250100.1 Uma2 family endonuclease [Crossiella sp. S99.1]